MTAKSISSEPRSRKPDLPSDIEERIRQRAYELYEQRSKADGFALDNCFPAESEIRGTERPVPVTMLISQ